MPEASKSEYSLIQARRQIAAQAPMQRTIVIYLDKQHWLKDKEKELRKYTGNKRKTKREMRSGAMNMQ